MANKSNKLHLSQSYEAGFLLGMKMCPKGMKKIYRISLDYIFIQNLL